MDKLTSGPASYILPIAMGAGAMASPRIGAGLGTALGVVDWARRNRKAAEEDQAFTQLAGALGGGVPAAPAAPTTAALNPGTSEGQTAATPTPTPGLQQIPGVTTEMLKNPGVAKALLPYIMSNYEKQNTPREHFGVAGNQPGVFQSPGIGKPYAFQPLGPKNVPNYAPNQDAIAMDMFGKQANELDQTQWQQLNARVKKETEEAKVFGNELIIDRQEKAQGRLLDKSAKLAEDARSKEDRTRAHSDFVGLNRWWDTGRKSIDAEASKQIAGIGAPNSTMGKKKAAEIEAWRKEQLQGLVDEYRGGYDDLKTRYQHLKEGLPWSSGKDTIVDIRIKKHGSTVGGADIDDTTVINKLRQNSPQDAADYQKILQSGNQEAINKARQRVKKFMGQ